MKKMTSQITPKHMLDNKILLKLEKIFNSIEIIPNSTYPLSEPSVQCSLLLKHEILKKLVTYSPEFRNKTGAFAIQTNFHHLKTHLVRFSDIHCIVTTQKMFLSF